MKEKILAKDELLGMLSEIYNQLDDLENVIEANISSLRQSWQNDYTVKLQDCSERIAELEKGTNYNDGIRQCENKINRNHPKSMKLELGY